jgi:predicted DNA-binding transcriptional regulator AlpA
MALQHAIKNFEYFGPVFSAQAIPPARAASRKLRRGLQKAQPTPDVRLPETGFLRLPEVLALFPVSRSAWWAGVKAGKYPAAVKLGPNTTAWCAKDIRRLIERHGGSATTRP